MYSLLCSPAMQKKIQIDIDAKETFQLHYA